MLFVEVYVCVCTDCGVDANVLFYEHKKCLCDGLGFVSVVVEYGYLVVA